MAPERKQQKCWMSRLAHYTIRLEIRLFSKKDRIKSFGSGSKQPVADNNTPEGKLKNRRAEALIFYKKLDGI